MLDVIAPIREITGVDPGALPDSLLTSTEPVVVRGLVSRWPLVQAATAMSAARSTRIAARVRDVIDHLRGARVRIVRARAAHP